jgi:hypothetical protein
MLSGHAPLVPGGSVSNPKARFDVVFVGVEIVGGANPSPAVHFPMTIFNKDFAR